MKGDGVDGRALIWLYVFIAIVLDGCAALVAGLVPNRWLPRSRAPLVGFAPPPRSRADRVAAGRRAWSCSRQSSDCHDARRSTTCVVHDFVV